MLVSPDVSTEGTAFIDVVVLNGQSWAFYYVHGVEGAAAVVPLLVSAPGFVSNSADITVVQPALDVSGVVLSRTGRRREGDALLREAARRAPDVWADGWLEADELR